MTPATRSSGSPFDSHKFVSNKKTIFYYLINLKREQIEAVGDGGFAWGEERGGEERRRL
jgi:hypothetical protein